MEESILNTTKKLLGVDPSYDSFDADITVLINSSLGILNQLGVGPDEGFTISGATETWGDYVSDDPVTLEMVKTYIYLKVRLAFDPPQTSGIIEAIKEQTAEIEWRLLVQNNPKAEG